MHVFKYVSSYHIEKYVVMAIGRWTAICMVNIRSSLDWKRKQEMHMECFCSTVMQWVTFYSIQ